MKSPALTMATAKPGENRCKKAFIDPKNQATLWATIQQFPLIHRVHPAELWFREIVAYFYEEEATLEDVPLYDALLDFNKRTLRFMVAQLREGGKPAAGSAPVAPVPAPFSDNLNDKMMQVVQGENKIKFEQEKDTPIRNMDELLLEQRALRDKEILPPLTGPGPAPAPPNAV